MAQLTERDLRRCEHEGYERGPFNDPIQIQEQQPVFQMQPIQDKLLRRIPPAVLSKQKIRQGSLRKICIPPPLEPLPCADSEKLDQLEISKVNSNHQQLGI